MEHLYCKHVLERIDSPGQHAVLEIHCLKADFVKCFQPEGHMEHSAMQSQFLLLNDKWKAAKKPYIILSGENNVSTFLL